MVISILLYYIFIIIKSSLDGVALSHLLCLINLVFLLSSWFIINFA